MQNAIGHIFAAHVLRWERDQVPADSRQLLMYLLVQHTPWIGYMASRDLGWIWQKTAMCIVRVDFCPSVSANQASQTGETMFYKPVSSGTQWKTVR